MIKSCSQNTRKKEKEEKKGKSLFYLLLLSFLSFLRKKEEKRGFQSHFLNHNSFFSRLTKLEETRWRRKGRREPGTKLPPQLESSLKKEKREGNSQLWNLLHAPFWEHPLEQDLLLLKNFSFHIFSREIKNLRYFSQCFGLTLSWFEEDSMTEEKKLLAAPLSFPCWKDPVPVRRESLLLFHLRHLEEDVQLFSSFIFKTYGASSSSSFSSFFFSSLASSFSATQEKFHQSSRFVFLSSASTWRKRKGKKVAISLCSSKANESNQECPVWFARRERGFVVYILYYCDTLISYLGRKCGD